mmetsp:Transcript_30396/g.75472  ORF Transcript_30396/g.75472 Transcript_30396/m.75472 type:complete len:86 (+) Transcript_30396:781-1038(+)
MKDEELGNLINNPRISCYGAINAHAKSKNNKDTNIINLGREFCQDPHALMDKNGIKMVPPCGTSAQVQFFEHVITWAKRHVKTKQ